MTLYCYIAWGVLYLLGAVFAVVNAPGLVGVLTCLLFFAPPAVLLYQGKGVRVIRNLSAAWLGLTALLLVLNILSVTMTEAAGTVLYYTMAVVSSPMVCGGNWLIALFGWACLLVVSQKLLKKK